MTTRREFEPERGFAVRRESRVGFPAESQTLRTRTRIIYSWPRRHGRLQRGRSDGGESAVHSTRHQTRLRVAPHGRPVLDACAEGHVRSRLSVVDIKTQVLTARIGPPSMARRAAARGSGHQPQRWPSGVGVPQALERIGPPQIVQRSQDLMDADEQKRPGIACAAAVGRFVGGSRRSERRHGA